MLPFGPTTPAGACTLKESTKERRQVVQGPSNRVGRRCGSWKKKGKKDGKLGRIGGGFAGGGGGVSRVYRGGWRRSSSSSISRRAGRERETERERTTGGRRLARLGWWVGGRGGGRTGPTGLENSPLFLLTLARCLIASYFRIFRVELSIETRERGVRLRLISDSPRRLLSSASLSLSPFFSLFPSCARPVPLLVFAHLIQLTHINPYSQKAWGAPPPWPVHPPFADYLKLHVAAYVSQ